MKKVSIIMQYDDKPGYNDEALNSTLQTLIQQNYDNWELVIVDSRGKNAAAPGLLQHEKIRVLTGDFKNRAQAVNAALKEVAGEYILLVNNEGTQVKFRLSTLEALLLIAERNENIGMIYADYVRIEEDGTQTEVHLLDHHVGRLRDNMDYGALLFFPAEVIQSVNGLNENYNAADLYDLRLKVASRYRLIHISAKKNGHLYLAQAAAQGHNVFDYLLAGKDVQLEMEKALTQHLKRIGAYLPPEKNFHEVQYTPEEDEKLKSYVASIIIPVFDRKDFIGTAIESVQAQTVQNVEILIMVNGGPTDSTIAGVKPYLPGGEKYDPNKPEVRLFIEDINNLGFCFNKGLQEARGKYYVQLDSDDRLKPDAVEKIVALFDSDSRIAMAIGSYEVWQKDEQTGELSRMEKIPVVTHDEWTEKNGRNNLLRINGAGAPRSAHIKIMREIGGFGMNDSPHCRNYGEDYDMVLRMSEKYRIGRIWEPIYEVIRHAGGTDHSIDLLTIERNDNAKDYMRKEAIERRLKIMANS